MYYAARGSITVWNHTKRSLLLFQTTIFFTHSTHSHFSQFKLHQKSSILFHFTLIGYIYTAIFYELTHQKFTSIHTFTVIPSYHLQLCSLYQFTQVSYCVCINAPPKLIPSSGQQQQPKEKEKNTCALLTQILLNWE